MAEPYLRQSPLAGRRLEARALAAPADAGVILSERPYRGQLALRGGAGNTAFVDALQSVLGVGPPAEPNTSIRHRGTSLLWLGPDEWLAVLAGGRETRVQNALLQALADQHAAVVDVSHARGVIGLGGPHARDVLRKGCSIDLHPRRFSAGRCIATGLARCHVLLHQLDDAPSYDLYVHRSFVDYAWSWLEDAGREYGVGVASSAA